MNYETLFCKALITTVVTESAAIATIIRFVAGIGHRRIVWPRIVGACIIPSCATLPYLWFVLPAFITDFYVRTIVGEVAITVTETVILKALLLLPWRYCALLSLVANCASIGAGLLIFR
jgi:uncharacterized protein YqhQ